MIRLVTSRISSRTVGQAPFRLRHLVSTVLLLAAIAGLSYQTVRGQRGLISWQNLQVERQERQDYLTQLTEENQHLAARADRLRENSLDLDFLDERARLVLGLGSQDEVIVFNRHLRVN